MTGKEKCRILRNVRRKIAQDNDIPFREDICDCEGDDCGGTCYVCDMELQQLEAELRKRREAGQKVTVERVCGEELQFHTADQPASGDDPDPVVLQAVVLPDGPGREDWEDMLLKLTRAGIATVGELQACTAEELTECVRLTAPQLEAAQQLLAFRGRRLKGSRRFERVRGRMEGRHGCF